MQAMKKVWETNNRKVIRYYENFGFVNNFENWKAKLCLLNWKKFKNKKAQHSLHSSVQNDWFRKRMSQQLGV